ncbi:hypothetical protein LC612_28515 [Nostoc sp. CHAB 5834]|nr:hypothetical protein [Nostoc sp. CHAB 5834]
MTKPLAIDTSRSTLLYVSGIGVILFIALAISNFPQLSLSNYFQIPKQKEICASLFMLGAFFGSLSFLKQMKRARTPWQTPLSQVSILYGVFFLLTTIALLIAK